MKYSIIKDSTPEETVKRINEILNNLNLEILVSDTGASKNYHSLRVEIKDLNMGVNGKGTSKINAFASGYAEFMERLQSQILIPFNSEEFYYEIDEKIDFFNFDNAISKNEFSDKRINVSKFLESNLYISKEKKEKLKSKTVYAPFVSCKKRKIEYLPIFCLYLFAGTNGLAAGNTYEEACVQALSEVIERYCAKEIFLKNLKMPIIPKKYYEKYDKIKKIIKEIEKQGFKITIKDASLGKKFPTVCVIYEDLKYPKNGITIKFGAHPYFPIALERTLTEFLQGFWHIQNKRQKIKFTCFKNDTKINKIVTECFTRTTFLKKTNKHIQNIISCKQDYQFDKNAWLFNEKTNNQKLLKYLIKLILNYSDDIYIRNYSFLNFPSVQVYVPNFSSPCILDLNFYENWTGTLKILSLIEEKKEITQEILEEIAKVSHFISDYSSNKNEWEIVFGKLRAKYFLFYYSVIKKDKKNIKKYLNKIIRELSFDNENIDNEIIKTYQAYNRYFKLYFAKKDEMLIKEKIEKQYSKEIYDEIKKTVELIDFNILKSYLTYQINPDEAKIKEISEKLCEKYKENPPKQDEILKIIDYRFKNNIGKFFKWNTVLKKILHWKKRFLESEKN